jgi:hypothetical protein
VIGELNTTWASTLGIRLELLQWRTHVAPGVGLDAQEVINKQIGDDFDIFIGIMWARFGSPTPRAGSGTEEEFDRALARLRHNPTALRIMFYFKNDPIAPGQIDPEQFARVAAFRKRLESEGVLYAEFTGPFDDFVRIHLSRELQDWVKSGGVTAAVASNQVTSTSEAGVAEPIVGSGDAGEDEGLLDQMADFQEHMAAAVDSQARLGATVEKLGADLTRRTEEVQRANSSGEVDYGVMRKLANRAAEDLEGFVSSMLPETVRFGEEFRGAIHSLSYVVSHADELPSGLNVGELRSTLMTLHGQIASNIRTNREFRDTFNRMPSLTKRFNTARRRADNVLERLGEEMEAQAALIQQVLDSLPSDDSST